ncbi:MAG: glycosyltransferase [Lachnospiraceae bacterium]|nr:glycosyltransferase [Lachnospiraceae bacterium]
MKKISIIITVDEKTVTIEECLKSLADQTIFNEIEIIIVDKGCDAEVSNTIGRYEQKYPETFLYVKTDSGIKNGQMKNIGLQYATGEYTGFVCAHDIVMPAMYEKLYTKAVDTEADYVDIGIYDKQSDKAIIYIHDSIVGKGNSEKKNKIISEGIGYLYTKIFKREFLFLNNITFEDESVPEDIDFLLECTYRAEGISFVKEIGYLSPYDKAFYECEEPKSILDSEKCIKAMLAVYKRLNYAEEYKEYLEVTEYIMLKIYSAFLYNCACEIYLNGKAYEELEEILLMARKVKDVCVRGGYNNRYVENNDKIDVRLIRENDISVDNLVRYLFQNLSRKFASCWRTMEDSIDEDDGLILTIAIPTYNRGKRALESVKHLLEGRKSYNLEAQTEIFISNNGSTEGVEEYDKIKEMADNEVNFNYFRFDENQQFVGNMINVIKRSKGKFCLIVSDEDLVDFEGLVAYIKYLKRHPEVSVMKGKTSKQYFLLEADYGYKGWDAISRFYLRGNYVSGIIYNREILTGETVDTYHKKYSNNNRGYYYYPHLFWDAYCMLEGSFASGDIPLITEGESEIIFSSTDILVYAYPEERIKQGLGYLDQIKDLNIDEELAYNMYILVFMKTKYLLSIQKDNYLLKGFDWEKICSDYRNLFEAAVSEYEYTNLEYKEGLINYLRNEKR